MPLSLTQLSRLECSRSRVISSFFIATRSLNHINLAATIFLAIVSLTAFWFLVWIIVFPPPSDPNPLLLQSNLYLYYTVWSHFGFAPKFHQIPPSPCNLRKKMGFLSFHLMLLLFQLFLCRFPRLSKQSTGAQAHCTGSGALDSFLRSHSVYPT